jgi:transcriptional regulator with XRE-family HTH domain
MDRAELADFLRRRRDRLHPADVGLVEGPRRRTAGLRRDEVAHLAGMSTDYYTRLEQRRGPHPSAPLLASLARALRLTDDERDHLFYLAGQTPPARPSTLSHPSPGLLYLLDRLTDAPAFIVSDIGETLVQNRMSVLVSGDNVGRNHTWLWFAQPSGRVRFPPEDWAQLSRTHVADLRATAARRRGDRDVETMVAQLRALSPEFAQLWDEHDVAVRRADTKRMIHAEVGVIDFLCETFTTGVGAQTLVVLFPQPGTDARDKLDLLRVVGLQDLTEAR